MKAFKWIVRSQANCVLFGIVFFSFFSLLIAVLYEIASGKIDTAILFITFVVAAAVGGVWSIAIWHFGVKPRLELQRTQQTDRKQ